MNDKVLVLAACILSFADASQALLPCDILAQWELPGIARGLTYDYPRNRLLATVRDNPSLYAIDPFTGATTVLGQFEHPQGALALDRENTDILWAARYERYTQRQPGILRSYDITSWPSPAVCDRLLPREPSCFNSGLVDGLAWTGNDSRLVWSHDLCDTFYETFTLTPCPSGYIRYQSPGRWTSGHTYDGRCLYIAQAVGATYGGGMIHRRRTDGIYEHIFNTQALDRNGELTPSEPEDLAWDCETFAPDCALWAASILELERRYVVVAYRVTPCSECEAEPITSVGNTVLGIKRGDEALYVWDTEAYEFVVRGHEWKHAERLELARTPSNFWTTPLSQWPYPTAYYSVHQADCEGNIGL